MGRRIGLTVIKDVSEELADALFTNKHSVIISNALLSSQLTLNRLTILTMGEYQYFEGGGVKAAGA